MIGFEFGFTTGMPVVIVIPVPGTRLHRNVSAHDVECEEVGMESAAIHPDMRSTSPGTHVFVYTVKNSSCGSRCFVNQLVAQICARFGLQKVLRTGKETHTEKQIRCDSDVILCFHDLSLNKYATIN